MSCLLEFGGAGGGGTPAGPSGAVQFNNAGAFGGDSGFTYAGSGQATYTLGTITANAKAVNIIGTWNNAAVVFDAPIFMNITNTASAPASAIVDCQVGGTTVFNIQPTANLVGGVQAQIGAGSTTSQGWIFGTDASGFSGIWTTAAAPSTTNYILVAGGGVSFINGSSVNLRIANSDRLVVQNALIQFEVDNAQLGSTLNLQLSRMAAGTLGILNSPTTSTAGLQVYNTSDVASGTPTNFERGVIDWTTTANQLTIGVQIGGAGSSRQLNFAVAAAGATFNWVGGTTSVMQLNGPGGGLNLLANGAYAFTASTTAASAPSDSGIWRAAPKVVEFSDGNQNANGWYQWAGQTRVTADVTFTSTTTLGTVTGLSVNVQAGRTYCFVVELSWTDAAAGGLQLAISGTCTATNIIYDGYIIDSAANGIKGNAQATALGGVVASSTTTGTAGHARIAGTITVNAAGTLLVQAAQNTSNATATTIKRGSFFYVYDNA